MNVRGLMREERKTRLQDVAATCASHEFVHRRLLPYVPEAAGTSGRAGWSVETVTARNSGRLTLRYDFASGLILCGTLFSDALGRRSYEHLHALWARGFGLDSMTRVPEPVAFLDDVNLLVMRDVEGQPLDRLLMVNPASEILPGIRAAARWLAQLHRTNVPGLQAESSTERLKLLKLANMMGKAAAARPQSAPLLMDQFHRLRQIAPASPGAGRLVPTHGQFTPANTFLAPPIVSITDLDRLCLSDPAKDVALFQHRVFSLLAFSAAAADADGVADAFADEYRAHACGPLDHLPYYTALFSLKAFAKVVKDHTSDDRARSRMRDLYLARMERCFGRAGGDGVVTPARRRAVEREGSLALVDPGFVAAHVLPVVGVPLAADRAPQCRATLLRRSRRRETCLYEIEGGPLVYAERLANGGGRHTFDVLTGLWRHGFDSRAPCRVPEPLGFLPDHDLVIMYKATGTSLGAILTAGRPSEITCGMRQAAHWLAALHRAPVRIGNEEPEWQSLNLFRVCASLISAAAGQPEHRDLLLDLTHSLKGHMQKLPVERPTVQTHGRFRPDNVWTAAGTTTAIAFDRSRPADPAKDLATFVAAIRASVRRRGVDIDRADHAARVFLDEYFAQAPAAVAGWPYHWSAHLVLSLFRAMKRTASADPGLDPEVHFHQQEIRRVMEARL